MKATNPQQEAIYSTYEIIININNDYSEYPKEYIDKALDITVGHIDNKIVYVYCDWNLLCKIARDNATIPFYAIQINRDLYAIPNYADSSKKLHPVGFMRIDDETKIDYDLINSIHRDLNNILKLYCIPVEFRGVKKIENGRISDLRPFRCRLEHSNLDMNVFDDVINRINRYYELINDLGFQYEFSDEYDEEIEELIGSIDDEILLNDSMCFTDYTDFIKETTGISMFAVPKVRAENCETKPINIGHKAHKRIFKTIMPK